MSKHVAASRKMLAAWARRPSQRAAGALRTFYGEHARELPLPMRAELCVALGEAADLEGRFEVARYLYASAVSAVDPQQDERLYVRAATRALLNASRLGDRSVLAAVARLVESLRPGETTPRLACLGALARGLERLLKEDWTGARKSFEGAMGAAWESQDADGEALAHHLLAQAWSRLGRVARANEHVEAAHAAAVKAGSWLLERRMALEAILARLAARVSAEGLAEARRYLLDVRGCGFPRLESMAWSKLAMRVLPGRLFAEAFLARSESLLPEGNADRAWLSEARSALARRSKDGAPSDPALVGELESLARLARA